MNITSLSAPLAQLVRSVATEFDLADIVSVGEMTGSANRLWQFTTAKDIFVVKELPYNDREQDCRLVQAANFEATLLSRQLVAGPTPVQNRSGGYVSILPDSRGKESPVRLHHWFSGTAPDIDDPVILAQAGSTLRAIQRAGASWSVRPGGSLQIWDRDPISVVEHFWRSGQWGSATSTEWRSTVTEALALVHAGESLPGDWIYTHYDHKPENCLSQDGNVAVLDWDECYYCHPRLEAVESALRWAGSDDPAPERFHAFMAGYNASGATLDRLHEPDFAKWIAGLLGWFCFQAQRSAGEWIEVTAAERTAAVTLAYDALSTLQSTLTAIPRWVRLL